MSFITKTEQNMKSAATKLADLTSREDGWEYLDSNELARKFSQAELITLAKCFNDALHNSLTN